MRINEALEILKRLPQEYTVALLGKPGIGKTALVEQLAKEKGVDLVTVRLGLLADESELLGILVKGDDGKAIYLKNELLARVCDKKFKGILFLDEFNRARSNILQAIFQLIEQKRVGPHKLSPHVRIILGGNLGDEDRTIVTEFNDLAFNRRFLKILLENSVPDLSAYIKGKVREGKGWWKHAGDIVDIVDGFLQETPNRLYFTPREVSISDNYVSPSHWEKVIRTLTLNKDLIENIKDKKTKKLLHTLLVTIIDFSTARLLVDYIAKYINNSNIKPDDILSGDKRAWSNLQTLKRSPRLVRINKSIAENIKTRIEAENHLTKEEINNLRRYIEFVLSVGRDYFFEFSIDIFAYLFKYDYYINEFEDYHKEAQYILSKIQKGKGVNYG